MRIILSDKLNLADAAKAQAALVALAREYDVSLPKSATHDPLTARPERQCASRSTKRPLELLLASRCGTGGRGPTRGYGSNLASWCSGLIFGVPTSRIEESVFGTALRVAAFIVKVGVLVTALVTALNELFHWF